MANTIAGFGQCMIKMARKYAPNAKLGFHASPWNIALNRDPSYDIESDGRAVGNSSRRSVAAISSSPISTIATPATASKNLVLRSVYC